MKDELMSLRTVVEALSCDLHGRFLLFPNTRTKVNDCTDVGDIGATVSFKSIGKTDEKADDDHGKQKPESLDTIRAGFRDTHFGIDFEARNNDRTFSI